MDLMLEKQIHQDLMWIIVSLVVFFNIQAHAFPVPSPEQQFIQSAVVLKGQIIDKPRMTKEGEIFRFKVLQVWKGIVEPEITLDVYGAHGFSQNENLLIYGGTPAQGVIVMRGNNGFTLTREPKTIDFISAQLNRLVVPDVADRVPTKEMAAKIVRLTLDMRSAFPELDLDNPIITEISNPKPLWRFRFLNKSNKGEITKGGWLEVDVYRETAESVIRPGK